MNGLESQLGGMGVAFASSLLGLAGSLVVGLLELFAGHGQNRFYRELEEWLSSITRLGFSSGDGEGMPEQNMALGVVNQMADQMDALQAMFAQSDASRALVDEKLSNHSGHPLESLGATLVPPQTHLHPPFVPTYNGRIIASAITQKSHCFSILMVFSSIHSLSRKSPFSANLAMQANCRFTRRGRLQEVQDGPSSCQTWGS